MAATDIFNRTSSVYGGSFAADKATMTFAGVPNGSVGQLIQNIQVSYQQMITKLYEVGSANVYFVGGRTQGQGNLGRVIGPASVQLAFYTKYGDICNIQNNVLTFNFSGNCAAGQTGASQASYTCGLTVVNTVGFNAQAQDMLVNEQVGFQFSTFNTSGS